MTRIEKPGGGYLTVEYRRNDETPWGHNEDQLVRSGAGGLRDGREPVSGSIRGGETGRTDRGTVGTVHGADTLHTGVETSG